LVRLGPRREVIDAVRGQIVEARGRVAFYESTLSNTLIKAPVSGTVLERNVEKGEFITTGFVGDKGAKGYVVSLADLNDLQVELDINQNDFARLDRKQKGVITTDAYPDRKYAGVIAEIAPEANRQKATVQVKVKVEQPDDYLRTAAVRNDAVYIILGGKVIKRAVRVSGSTSEGLRVEEGLIGGEDLVLNPPAELKDGDKVKLKGTAK